jgi:putative restriction endonuclease
VAALLDETRIRLDAIHYVRALRERWVAIPVGELKQFESDGKPIFLKGQQGIFKPAELSEPLSITSTIDSPYNDAPQGSCILYDFLPDSHEHDNVGLKRCAEALVPIIYLLQVKKRPAEYVAFAPVYVVGWDDEKRRFLVDLSEQKPGEIASPAPLTRQLDLPVVQTPSSPSEMRAMTKSYVVSSVQRRLFEAKFRNEILAAYGERCAVCGLRYRPLLDAAHVVSDREPKPSIVIREGIALCATHHRAFDANILRYDEEHVIHIDLPDNRTPGEGELNMLAAFEGRKLLLPSDPGLWPAPQR